MQVSHCGFESLRCGWQESHDLLDLRLHRQLCFNALPALSDGPDLVCHFLAFHKALGNLIDDAGHFPLGDF
ncbi:MULTISPECIES: hypothetical protein [unclassified Mesorhizobium]|uniref:hypothetical protein n=1 Tax=unclassified Mesorhizobium TaxID=325217 RepID=UPI001FEFE875|nr:MULTISPECIES: hypothetical protein [unclassified Mesorhizobium]